MSEEKMIVGGNEKNEKTMKLTQRSRIGKLFARYSKRKAGLGGIAVGAAGVFGLMSIGKPDPVDETGTPLTLPKPEISAEPLEATVVTDDMSFNEAFAAARNEVGATGYFTWHGKVFNPIYDGELNQLSADEQKLLFSSTMKEWGENHLELTPTDGVVAEPLVVIYDEAPVSVAVTDDMSFRDAFAVARADVGPGGTFTWHGKEYSTYTSEEWNSMGQDEQQEFMASSVHTEIAPANVSQQDVDIETIDNTGYVNEDIQDELTGSAGEASTVSETEILLSDEYVPDGQGGVVHVALFEVNGQTVMRVDTDGNGSYDTEMVPDGNGNIIVSNEAGEETLVSQEDIEQLQAGQESSDPGEDIVYPDDVIPESDFNPDDSGSGDWDAEY